MPLGDAKWVVHRNLDPAVREATERLWDDLLDGLDRTGRTIADRSRQERRPPEGRTPSSAGAES
jgi:hypothetical protein